MPEGVTLDLEALRALAHERTPNSAIADADLRLARAHLAQAQAWANPEVEVEGARARASDGGSLNVGRVTVRQRLEAPAKRDRRVEAARGEQATAAADARALAVDLDQTVEAAAVEAAVLQRAVVGAQHAVELTGQIGADAQRRMDAGEATRSDLLRARVDAHQAETDLAQRRRSLLAALASLNAACGGALPRTFTVRIDLEALPTMTLPEALAAAAASNPDLLRQDTVVEQRRREVAREEAAAVPDLTVGVFAGREADSRDLGLALGVEVPLWDRNQGGIAAARAQLDRDAAERERERRGVLAEVQAAWYEYDAAVSRAQDYARSVSPAAAEALAATVKAYEAGESGFLDVLDARRTAQEVERAQLEALRDAQSSRIRLDRAIGMPRPTAAASTDSTVQGATP